MKRLTDIDQTLEKRKNDRKVKVYFAIAFGVIGIFIALFLSGLLLGKVKMYDYCESANEKWKAQFRGIVIDKFFVRMNHNAHSLTIRNGDGREIYLQLSDDRNQGEGNKSKLWLQVSVGDSIAKDANAFQVFYKPSGRPWTSVRLIYNLANCRD